MRRNFSETSEIESFFRPKTGGLHKKKKKVFTEIETDFSAKIGNSNVFSAQKQVVSKKHKKNKKRSSPKLRLIFDQNRKFKRFFHPKSGGLRKKKKKVFTEIHTLFQAVSRRVLHNIGTQFLMEGCFQFFTKNRPQKHQKRAILHTLQANGGARASRPPGYATGCGLHGVVVIRLR